MGKKTERNPKGAGANPKPIEEKKIQINFNVEGKYLLPNIGKASKKKILEAKERARIIAYAAVVTAGQPTT